MMLVFLVLALAALPLMLLSNFPKLVMVSAYAGLVHLVLLAGFMLAIWFGLRHKAICRVWRRRNR